jgi:hypothetical protein
VPVRIDEMSADGLTASSTKLTDHAGMIASWQAAEERSQPNAEFNTQTMQNAAHTKCLHSAF